MWAVQGLINGSMMFNIPLLPDEVLSYIDEFFDYLVVGAGILANYTPFTYLMTLLGIVISVDGAIAIYHFVMWVLRKIPALAID